MLGRSESALRNSPPPAAAANLWRKSAVGQKAGFLRTASFCQRETKREAAKGCLSFLAARLLPAVKGGRCARAATGGDKVPLGCGELIEIVQEKPAKGFPAHTLFLAKSRSAFRKSILTAYSIAPRRFHCGIFICRRRIIMNVIQKSESIKTSLQKGFQDGGSKMAHRKRYGYEVGPDGELTLRPEEAK